MILGMPTLIEMKNLDVCAALCSELNMNLPRYRLNGMNGSYYKEISEEYGIFYTVHLDENLNISDFNPYIVVETICFSEKQKGVI